MGLFLLVQLLVCTQLLACTLNTDCQSGQNCVDEKCLYDNSTLIYPIALPPTNLIPSTPLSETQPIPAQPVPVYVAPPLPTNLIPLTPLSETQPIPAQPVPVYVAPPPVTPVQVYVEPSTIPVAPIGSIFDFRVRAFDENDPANQYDKSVKDDPRTIKTTSAYCPFLSPALPPFINMKRDVVVLDLDSTHICPSDIKQFFTEYNEGDLASGSSICNKDSSDLNNCVFLSFNSYKFEDPMEASNEPLESEPITAISDPMNLPNFGANLLFRANRANVKNLKEQKEGKIVKNLKAQQGSLILPAPTPWIYLEPDKRNTLQFKWPRWNSENANNTKSDGVTVYASSKQSQSSYFSAPTNVVISRLVNAGPPQEWEHIEYQIGEDLRQLMISSEQALTDFAMGNVYPDYNNSDNRMMAGSLRVCFYLTDMTTELCPYYHANFHAYFPLAFFYEASNAATINGSFNNLLTNWNNSRTKFNLTASEPQTPVKSPWDPLMDLSSVPWNEAAPNDIAKFAILISIPANDPAHNAVHANDINLAAHVLHYSYKIDQDNIYKVNNRSLPQSVIDTIKEKATEAKAQNKRTQLVIFIEGHGNLRRIETTAPIGLTLNFIPNAFNLLYPPPGTPALTQTQINMLNNDEALRREGAFEHTFGGIRGDFTESGFKTLLKDNFQNPNNPANNKVDDVFLIEESCHGGASVI